MLESLSPTSSFSPPNITSVGASIAVGLALLFADHVETATAASLQFFGPGSFSSDTSAMDTAIGITGFTIEDFEDTTLIPTLSITHTFRNNTNPDVTYTSLPNLSTGGGLGQQVTGHWDGLRVFDNSLGNVGISNGLRSETTTFNFAATQAFGIGLASFQSLNPQPQGGFPITDHEVEILVNGNSVLSGLESLDDWVASIFGRNGYLLVTAGAGETISSVSFRNLQAPGGSEDYLVYDHLALHSTAVVPLPAAFPLLAGGLGLMGLLGWRRKRKVTSTT